MGQTSDESQSQDSESEISESEIEDYSETFYSKLKSKEIKVKKKGKLRCPFCRGKKKQNYKYKDLYQHAMGVSNSHKHTPKIRSKHRALAKYLKTDFANPNPNLLLQVAQVDPTPPPQKTDEKYVYPWKGILVNVPIERLNGEYVASEENLVGEIIVPFKPLDFYPLTDEKGHLGKCIVDFGTEWDGFRNLSSFNKYFNSKGRGREGYKIMKEKERREKEIFGWMLIEEDYNGSGPVKEHLRQIGELKSINDVMKEKESKFGNKMKDLVVKLEEKNEEFKQMEYKYNQVEYNMRSINEKKEILTHTFNQEMKEIEERSNKVLEKYINENQNLKAQVELKRIELETRNKLVNMMDSSHQQIIEQKKMESLRKMEIEKEKADQEALRLVEEQKREKEEMFKKILQLEKQLDTKQQLEMDIEKLRGQIKIMNHMKDGDEKIHEKIKKLEEDLKEKEEEREGIEEMNQVLFVKERESNDQLQEARKELKEEMKELLGKSANATIVMKRMGELDFKVFQRVYRQKYTSIEEADIEATKACSKWEEELKDANWHPFKIVTVDRKPEEVVKEDDEKLIELKENYGEEICEAVLTARRETNEYNPSGSYVVTELWHRKADRKATMKEVLKYVFDNWKASKSRKR